MEPDLELEFYGVLDREIGEVFLWYPSLYHDEEELRSLVATRGEDGRLEIVRVRFGAQLAVVPACS